MTGPSQCACGCGNSLDPTLAFQRSPCCESCHQRLHGNQKELYMGTSAKGVADVPSRMFAAQVTCDGCHTHPVSTVARGEKITGEQNKQAQRQSCVDCHGPGYDRMLDTWMQQGEKMLAAIAPEINSAQALLQSQVPAEARPLLEDAVANFYLVKQGRPAHNVEYSVRALQTAWDQLDVARAAITPGYRPRLRPPILGTPDGYCTAMCHGQIGLPQQVYFNEMKLDFPHRRHVEEIKVPCTRCHSPDQHKMRIITKAGCMECHHGQKGIACETCHVGVQALRQGTAGGVGVKAQPDPMAGSVSCTDCHDLKAPAQTVREIKPRCAGCHDDSYAKLLDKWFADWKNQRAKVEALLEAAKLRIEQDRRAGQNVAGAEKGLAEAETNFRITEAGHGVHNLDYTLGLLQAAQDRLNKIVESEAPAPAPAGR